MEIGTLIGPSTTRKQQSIPMSQSILKKATTRVLNGMGGLVRGHVQLYLDSWPMTLSCSSTKMHLQGKI
jgi:hypothetical protein